MILGCQMQIFRVSSFMQPIADKGKKSLFLNAARGRRGWVSFLLQTSIYQARYGEQVRKIFKINQLSLLHLKVCCFCP